MADARKGKKLSEEHKEKISKKLKGQKRSSEFSEKIRILKTGMPCKEETKIKLSEAQKKHSEEISKRSKITSADWNVYTFFNINTNETFTGNKNEFKEKFNFGRNVNEMFRKSRKLYSYFGWVLVENKKETE